VKKWRKIRGMENGAGIRCPAGDARHTIREPGVLPAMEWSNGD